MTTHTPEAPTPTVQRRGVRGSAAGTLAVVGLAGAAWLGAVRAAPVSLWWPAGLAILLIVAALRRGAGGGLRVGGAVVVAGGGALVAALLASALAADAWSGLDAPVPARIDGRVELVGDPRPTRHGVRAEIRWDGRLWDLTASDAAAGVLGGLRAGESVEVVATTRAREPDDRWRASRHVAGTATAEWVGSAQPAWGPWRLANAVHRALLRSTAHLPPDARGIALGVALGDRGAIDDLLAEDLRAAGLSHLTAVSGQHVALLVAMTAPILGRLSARQGAVATLTLLAGFVILTRGEPSVLRAAAMATVVTLVRARGRHAVAVRVLAVVVVVLVLVDPMLVWSVGFQLSVAATTGIVLGASRLTARLPGPRPVAAALGISLAAQVAVTPLVIIHFGVMPLVGLGANLAVVPVIGPLMGWALAAGLLAGGVPSLAEVVHLPTMVLAGWVARVAQWSAGLGLPGLRLGGLGALGMAVLGVAGAVAAVGWLVRRRRVVGAGVLALVVVLGVGLVGGGGPNPGRHELGAGAEAVVGGGRVVLIVDGRAAAGAVVGGLRQIGAVSVDVVLARSAASSAATTVEAVRTRLGAIEVLVPAGAPVSGAVVVDARREIHAGAIRVVAAPGGDGRLDVDVSGPV